MATYYFAWVDPGETTFQPAHQRVDENVFAFEIVHSEGEFAQLQIDVRNPRVGLLNAGRKLWAWLACDDGGSVTPLFFGRLVGIPLEMHNELVRLAFTARPANYDGIKRALADTLRVEPYWDPLWINPEERDSPDSVLEARPELFHIDRVTHAVTTSHMVNGEDGTLELGGDFYYDSLSIQFSAPAARKIRVVGEVGWTQVASAEIDISKHFRPPLTTIRSYTGTGLFEAWPKGGESIGNHWEVSFAEAFFLNGTYIPQSDEDGFITTSGVLGVFHRYSLAANMRVRYDLDRQYTEQLSFEMEADVQALLVEPGDEEVEEVFLSANADEPIDPPAEGGSGSSGASGSGGLLPAQRDPTLPRFFQTERGLRALKWLMLMARARLLVRARAIEVSVTTRFENGLALSCRKNMRINDPRLPGGTALGKVMGYTLGHDGDSGEAYCTITIGCSVGHGQDITAGAGEPVYVEDGYVTDGYLYRLGQEFEVLENEVNFVDFSAIQPNDDGIDLASLNEDNAVEYVHVIRDAAYQKANLKETIDMLDGEQPVGGVRVLGFGERIQVPKIAATGEADPEAIAEAFNEMFTEIELKLVRFEPGPFLTEMPIAVSMLRVPQTIDLSAASAPE